jgi:hypothetical protein
MRKKISIPKEDLIRLYYEEKKSKYKIGDIYGCSFSTVLNIMRAYGLEPLSRSIIQSKYSKNNFDGPNELKAYIIGFRLGDLNVYKTSAKSEVVVVRCHTTNQDQVDIMEDLFSNYGKVSVNKSIYNGSFNINCFVNNSFLFLLPKSDAVPYWIAKNIKAAIAFVAGYVDAEGNIGVYDGRARFKLDSYDKNILIWIFNWLKRNKINCPDPKKIGEKNQIYNKVHGYKYNKDLWRLRISEMDSLEIILKIIKPYLKHKKRIADLNRCLLNINDRKNRTNR